MKEVAVHERASTLSSLAAERSDIGVAAEHLLDEVETLVGLAGAHEVTSCRNALQKPTAIAVTGRVNTGKSTLVNALIGAKMAPTSSQETTALLSHYTYGAPTRAEAMLLTGKVLPVSCTPNGPDLGDIQAESVSSLHIYLQSSALRLSTFIDTPGLESAVTKNSARTFEGILPDGNAATRADVLLFLVRDAFRPDDKAFLARFTASRTSDAAPAQAIGLLAHADNFGGGPWRAVDPIDEARKAALALRMPGLTTVLPVSALLAETVRTGALTENDARVLRRLKDVDAAHLQFFEQLGAPAEVDVADLRRLTRLVGAYGLRFGRQHCASLSQLLSWLYERSGLEQLDQALERTVTGPAECSRVETMLSGLMDIARSKSWPSEVRMVIEAARHSPAFHRLEERNALELLRSTQPNHGLVPVLEVLAGGREWPPALTPQVPDGNGYLELASKYQSLIGTATTGAEAKATRAIARSLLIRSAAVGNGA